MLICGGCLCRHSMKYQRVSRSGCSCCLASLHYMTGVPCMKGSGFSSDTEIHCLLSENAIKRTGEVGAVFCRSADGYQILDNAGRPPVTVHQGIVRASFRSCGHGSRHQRGDSARPCDVDEARAARRRREGVERRFRNSAGGEL